MKLLAYVSVAILAFQIYIPWSVPHFVTQDGPSHVYTAFVTKDLLFHRHVSPYHELYRVQKTALPNWTGTLILAGFLGVFGPERAEAFLMTLCLLAGYGAIAYCAGALSGATAGALMMGNWLTQSWFLWAGFYNFYLGMALLMALVGFFIRHQENINQRLATLVAVAMVFIFFTHLIPAVLAAVALFVIGAWARNGWGALARLTAAIVPTAALVLAYAAGFHGRVLLQPDTRAAFLSFPRNTFFYASGWVGEMRVLWPAGLCLIVAAILLMRRTEWKSARGALAVMAGIAFCLYLLIPDLGFSGSVVKMRFAWAVFLFGGILVYSVDRLRRFQVATAVIIAASVLAQLAVAARQVRQTSAAAGIYLAAMDQLPEGARFVRVRYPAPLAAREFETDRLSFDPLLHLEALGAVRRHAVDLSDYQSAAGIFSVAFKPKVSEGQSGSLWGLESPEAGTLAGLDWVRESIPIDYAVVFGEEPPEEMRSRGKLVGAEVSEAFVRVYRLLPAAAQGPVKIHHSAEFIAAQAGQIELAGK